jgi:Na+/H+ antiporter NhaC
MVCGTRSVQILDNIWSGCDTRGRKETPLVIEPTWISLVPAVLAVVLAFALRDAVVALLFACVAGVLLLGQGLQGFPGLVTRSLGTPDFIWVFAIELCIGVLVAFLQRSGAIALFRQRASRIVTNRKRAGVMGWVLGLSVFFSDYFSPLFVGAVMRDLTDRYRISREKLSYICDSTSASVIVLIPMSGWAVYLAGLAASSGLGDRDAALDLFIRSIPFNLYGILTALLVGLIVLEIVPDFGPMRKAERRARETGKVLRDGATPMMGRELTDIEVSDSPHTGIGLNFILPVALIVGVNVWTFVASGSAAVLESFMLACAVLGLTMWLQRVDTARGLVQTALAGMKGVMGAVLILALAYCINTVSREMQTAAYVAELSRNTMSPALLPVLAFVIAGFVSFSTGTSWGTYAIMVPIVLPLAIEFSGGTGGALVALSFAAVAGGGVFGDHCSPLSDTTVLSSLGGACDHIDHTRTQIPYALAVGLVVCFVYLVLGLLLVR